MDRIVAYIDGFNLYFGLKDKGWKRYYWLDLATMIQKLLEDGERLVRVNYFTSRVKYPEEKRRRQSTYLDALGTKKDLSIYYGRYQRNDQECRFCHQVSQNYSEKKSDVNIAVEMLADAFQDRFDTAYLVSADADLSAPITKIRHLFPKKKVVVAFPPERTSFELRNLASRTIIIGRGVLANSLLPDQITTTSGYVLRRPEEWR